MSKGAKERCPVGFGNGVGWVQASWLCSRGEWEERKCGHRETPLPLHPDRRQLHEPTGSLVRKQGGRRPPPRSALSYGRDTEGLGVGWKEKVDTERSFWAEGERASSFAQAG